MNGQEIARLGRLDGLRGVAALGVALTFHAQFMFNDPSTINSWAGPISEWLAWKGWLLVDLFFLISGYIFAHVYLPGDPLKHRGGVGRFALARIARLYPLHLVMLAFAAVAFYKNDGNTLTAFIGQLFMLQVFIEPIGNTFVGPSWSISVEFVCYVLFVLTARFMGRWMDLAFVLLALAAFGFLLSDMTGTWDMAGRVLRGVQGFFLGVILWRQRERLARIPWPLLALAIPAGFALAVPIRDSILTFTMLTLPAVLLLALRLPLFERPVLTWLGDRSYAIYLIHMPMIDMIRVLCGPKASFGPLATLGIVVVFLAILLALSDLAYRRIECPARQALRNLPRKQSRALPAA